jgi:glycosyltransferase involved in cell wall biosynthesis
MPSQPIRVAHLMQYFAVGGLERMVERLAVEARRYGVDSLVIGYLGDGPVRSALEAAGVRTVMLPIGPGLRLDRVAELRSILIRERIDVLHTHHLGPFLYGASAAFFSRTRLVHTEHSHEFYDKWRRRWVGASMSKVGRVVAVTPEIAEFRRQFPGDCRVIRNGVALPGEDPSLRVDGRRLLGAGPETFVVGCVARLAAEKDHATLLSAFGRLLDRVPDSLLACAGDGPLREELERSAVARGFESRVRWLGALDDMSAFYPAIDASVLSSVREGLPLSLLEAMSYGRPVVATDVGGVPELLSGDAGLLVPSGASDALADALVLIATNTSLGLSLGRAARVRVSEGYGIDQMVKEYVELYRNVGHGSVHPSQQPGAVPCD